MYVCGFSNCLSSLNAPLDCSEISTTGIHLAKLKVSPLGNSLLQPCFHDPLATTILLSVPVNLTYRYFTDVEANGLCAFISLRLSKVYPHWDRSVIAFT